MPASFTISGRVPTTTATREKSDLCTATFPPKLPCVPPALMPPHPREGFHLSISYWRGAASGLAEWMALASAPSAPEGGLRVSSATRTAAYYRLRHAGNWRGGCITDRRRRRVTSHRLFCPVQVKLRRPLRSGTTRSKRRVWPMLVAVLQLFLVAFGLIYFVALAIAGLRVLARSRRSVAEARQAGLAPLGQPAHRG